MSGRNSPNAANRVIAFIALGSNLDNPERQVLRGFDELAQLPDSTLTARSSLYASAPVGYTDQPDFINAVAQLETALPSRDLLAELLAIEQKHGRKRDMPNGPRTIDLDLLLYADLQYATVDLVIPHPRMHNRAFVLLPLTEIAADCEIPGKGLARDWLPQVDQQSIKKLKTT